MQDRYAGDIGDFIKFSLLRELSKHKKLGVAWYLHPDEAHNADGKHITYLAAPEWWRHLDPKLFDALAPVAHGERSVHALENGNLVAARFSGERLLPPRAFQERSAWRAGWFDRVLADLQDTDIVFADPDNGLVDDDLRRRSRKSFGKKIPLLEARALAAGRTAVIYHHNTRWKGGHDLEVDYWISRIGLPTIAIRANAYSCRTFFIINPDAPIIERANAFCKTWAMHSVRLHRPQGDPPP